MQGYFLLNSEIERGARSPRALFSAPSRKTPAVGNCAWSENRSWSKNAGREGASSHARGGRAPRTSKFDSNDRRSSCCPDRRLRISDFGLPSDFGFRISDFFSHSSPCFPRRSAPHSILTPRRSVWTSSNSSHAQSQAAMMPKPSHQVRTVRITCATAVPQ